MAIDRPWFDETWIRGARTRVNFLWRESAYTSNLTDDEESSDLHEDVNDGDSVHHQESSDTVEEDVMEQLEDQEWANEEASTDSVVDNLVVEEKSFNVATVSDYSRDSEAIMLMSTGDYNGAIEAWTRLIRIEESAGRWNGLAESLEALGYSNRANKARGLEPHLPLKR